MPMYFCCVGVCHLLFCALRGGCLLVGCVPVVAWLNSIDGSRHLFGSVRGGVVDMLFNSRIF